MSRTLIWLMALVLAMLGILAAKSIVIFKTDGTKVVNYFDDFTEVTYPTTNTIRVHKTDLSTVDYNAGDIDSIQFASYPVVSTLAATNITQTHATLNGTVNPNNGGITIVVFEYGVTTEYGTVINASQSPVANGANEVAVSVGLSGLTHNTTYHYRVKATNSGGMTNSDDMIFTTESWPTTVTDIDGNVYSVVMIGNQLWMAENLKVTHYRNGDPIPNVTDKADWKGLATGALCAYNNSEANAQMYGNLYNWYAVTDSRNIAPEGFHVPTEEEFQELLDAVGTNNRDRYNALIDGGSSGFNALLGGCRTHGGYFYGISGYARFWAATPYPDYNAWYLYLSSYGHYAVLSIYGYRYGFSVRCVKD